MINVAKKRMRFNPFAIMKSMREDYLYIALSAFELRNGNTLSQEDLDKLHQITIKHEELYEYLR